MHTSHSLFLLLTLFTKRNPPPVADDSFTAEMNFLERVGNYVLAKLVSIVSANVRFCPCGMYGMRLA